MVVAAMIMHSICFSVQQSAWPVHMLSSELSFSHKPGTVPAHQPQLVMPAAKTCSLLSVAQTGSDECLHEDEGLTASDRVR